MEEKVNVGIIGATGYAGVELLRLLLSHSKVKVAAISSKSYEGENIQDIYPNFREIFSSLLCDNDTVIDSSDIVFSSLPSGFSEPIARQCVDKGKKLIDLGADFRLKDEKDYKNWYNLEYNDKELHDDSVYSIPELHKDLLTGKSIIGNPGCYPTSICLGIAPILKNKLFDGDIIIDSKSGVTGAGRGLSITTHFPECNSNFSAYKISQHRHTPEIEQTLSNIAGKKINVTFVPHLIPINRGILSTIYVKLKKCSGLLDVYKIYVDFYSDCKFVRVLPVGSSASIKNVKYSNYCDVSLHLDKINNRLIICSAIDNTVKGAAGQAIQNMNLMLGFDEDEGLNLIPPAF